MWKCPKCSEALPDGFAVCWSCGTSKDGVLDPHFHSDSATAAPENEPLQDIDPTLEQEREHMVTVAQCNVAAEAHAMRIYLESAGIPVFLADELTVAMDWLLSNAIGGVKVQVPERCSERALQLLEGFVRTTNDDSDLDEHDTDEL
jgi:hypothetical protein